MQTARYENLSYTRKNCSIAYINGSAYGVDGKLTAYYHLYVERMWFSAVLHKKGEGENNWHTFLIGKYRNASNRRNPRISAQPRISAHQKLRKLNKRPGAYSKHYGI